MRRLWVNLSTDLNPSQPVSVLPKPVEVQVLPKPVEVQVLPKPVEATQVQPMHASSCLTDHQPMERGQQKASSSHSEMSPDLPGSVQHQFSFPRCDVV